jgi:DNA repair protein RadC
MSTASPSSTQTDLFSPSSSTATPSAPASPPEPTGAARGSFVRTQVSEWPDGERPWQKLLSAGPGVLSNAEILSVLIGRGTRLGEEVITSVDIGRELLRRFETPAGISDRPVLELTALPGIGKQTAARLAAAIELGRRIESGRAGKRVQVCNPEDVAGVYGPLMRDLTSEVFKIVFLNTANVIIGDETVSEGGLSAAIVEPRAIFRSAIGRNAAAIIALHNHPSGNSEPSRADIKITRQIASAGEVMGIPLHDHLIIAGTNHTSLAERGVIS